MAEHMINDARILVGSHQFSGEFNSVTLSHTAESLDNTAMGDTARSHMGGIKEVQLTGTILKDFTNTTGNDEVYDGYLATANVPVTVSAQGGDAGEIAYFFQAVHVQVPRISGTVGDLHVGDISASGSDGVGLVRGYILEDGKTARTQTFNTASVEIGAIAAGKTMYAVLHCWSASASDTLDVVIYSDADDNWTAGKSSRITFTQVGSATYEWKTLAGPVTDTYWRAECALGGSGISFNFAVVAGIK